MKKILCVLLVAVLCLACCGETVPERIVSGYYISTSLVLALGGGDRLVGIEAKANTRALYALAAPELIELPSVGTLKQLDLEAVIGLNPDLIILPLKQLEAANTLRELGFTVVVVNPESYEEMLETIDEVAAAMGADAGALREYYAQKTAKLAALVEGKPSVQVYLAGNSSYLKTAGEGMYQDTLLNMAGGTNVAAEIEGGYWTEISYEQLLEWNPEVIIMAADAAYTREDILNDALLQGVAAVKTGRVYALPSVPEAWDSPVPGAILGSLWIAAQLYPEEYGAAEFTEDANEFYMSFYGFEFN